MKHLAFFIVVFFLSLFSNQVVTQAYFSIEDNNSCAFYEQERINGGVAYGHARSLETEEQIQRILDAVGLPANFEIKSADVRLALALIQNGRRYILYNPKFIAGFPEGSREFWLRVAILAHELGHHLEGHSLGVGGSRQALELQADQFSGFALARMGATLEQAQAAVRRASESGSPVYPPRSARLEAVAHGWKQYAEMQPGSSQSLDEAEPLPPPPPRGSVTDHGMPIPSFPLPPPRPSASYVLPPAYLSSARTLGQIDQQLSLAVAACGYIEKSYFAVPSGFAMATLMEQIDPNTAAPLPPPDRWDQKVGELQSFSLKQYLQALVFGHTGSFRVFVFVVTPVAFTSTGRTPTQQESEAWLREGLNKLPARIRHMPFTDDHRCTVLIYEFEKKEGDEPRFVERSRFSSRTHLERARILEALARP